MAQQPASDFQELRTKDSIISMAIGLAVIVVAGLVAFNYFSARNTAPDQSGTETADQTPVAPITEPTTHTVTAGDTLWNISERYYKTGFNWVDIQNANNLSDAANLTEGQQLTIPVVTPIMPLQTSAPEPTGNVSGIATGPTGLAEIMPTEAALPSPMPTEQLVPITTPVPNQTPTMPKSYTVVRGDSLWKIAVAVYGNGYRWSEIAQLNNLDNPDIIHAGNILQLPN